MKRKALRTRLDLALVERGLVSSQKEAAALILAGEVTVDGARADKAGLQVTSDTKIQLAQRQSYVSRGGLKLEGALEDLGIDPTGRVCLDIGASTGGFTDCLLQKGAQRVFAVDVNVAQLDWRLQQDPLVFPIEHNARDLTPLRVPEAASLVAIDVSFISVRKILRPAIQCASPDADFVVLIKPQFELRREDIPKGGVVTDPGLHQKAIAAVETFAVAQGLQVVSFVPSRLTGAEGNREFFLHARKRL